MTTYKSDQVQDALYSDYTMPGVALVAYGEYTPAATLAVADVIQMVGLPANCEIMDIFVWMDTPFSSPGCQVNVTGPATFMSTLKLKTKGDSLYSNVASSANVAKYTQITTADTIDLTLLSELGSNGATVKMRVHYQMLGSRP